MFIYNMRLISLINNTDVGVGNWIISCWIVISALSTASRITCQTIGWTRLARGLLILCCRSQIVSILTLRATITRASQAVGRACRAHCLVHLRAVQVILIITFFASICITVLAVRWTFLACLVYYCIPWLALKIALSW